MIRVEYDRATRCHAIVITVDADAAEDIANAFGPDDGFYRDLVAAAATARRLDAPWDEGEA